LPEILTRFGAVTADLGDGERGSAYITEGLEFAREIGGNGILADALGDGADSLLADGDRRQPGSSH
jgi:hypothetical protein